MGASLLSILVLGFLLGIKHAIEPDHVIAVSTIASETRTLKKSAFAGVYWGIGHTATLFIFGMFFIAAKNSITDGVALSLEFCVGIMLVYLGISSMVKAVKKHEHVHRGSFEKRNHANVKSFFVGLVHGLAGSAAMVLLTMSTVSSVWEGGIYILIFGLGTIAGMLCFSTIIGIPFVLSKGNHTNKLLNQVTGVISTVFGLYYMYSLGVKEGLFTLWFS